MNQLHPEQQLKKAQQLYQQQAYSESLQLCDSLLSEYRPHADVLTLKALVHLETGQLDEAGDSITRALSRNPDHPGMLSTAALINQRLSNFKEARRQALQSARQVSATPAVIWQSATVLGDVGEPELTLEILQDLAHKHRGHAETWFLIGRFQVALGDSDAAEKALRKCLALDTRHSAALHLLVRVAAVTLADTDITGMLESISAGSGRSRDRVIAKFALAHIYRKEGRFKEAFGLFHEANSEKAAKEPFDPVNLETRTREVIEGSTRTGFQQEIADSDATKMVFVCGMPRSGTTLCEQVLSAHSGVFGCGELNRLALIAQRLKSKGIDLNLDTGVRPGIEDEIKQARSEYLAVLPAGHREYQWLSDKSVFNTWRLGLIKRLFPSSKVLFCIRHPLDTILSCYFREFRSGGEFSTNLDHLARVYADHLRIMRHWQNLLPGMISVVRYSDMIDDLEGQARDISSFLNIEFEAAMLEPHKNARAVMTASNLQVRRPIYNTALNVWKNYREELESVTAFLQQQSILDEQSEMLL